MFKYPRLTNHYNDKDIKRFNFSPDIEFCISEKLHGANFSIKFNEKGNTQYFSRNQEITGSNFYNAIDVINSFIEEKTPLIKPKCVDKNIILFGELFGGNIQTGVNYGKEKRLAFFDCAYEIDGNYILLSQSEFILFCSEHEIKTVPFLGFRLSFEEAMNYDINFDTYENSIIDNLCEGIVIKPLNEVIYDKYGQSIFYIKKKNEKFKEKQRTPKEPKLVSDNVQFWSDEFDQYIHKERLESVFSKEGKIETVKDIGKYIGLVINDAKETFLKEEANFNENDFDKSELKTIFNKGNVIKELLMEELK